MGYPQKVDVKNCAVVEPQHPCDPPRPCDPHQEPDGECVAPFLCYERLKNPEDPDYSTRCKQGASIGVRTCTKPPPEHPCDPLAPCSTLTPPKKMTCDEPPLCKERIKNTELEKIRRVRCTDSKGNIKEVELKKK